MINRIEGFFENDGPPSSEFKQKTHCTKEIMKLAEKLTEKGVDPSVMCKAFVRASIELSYSNAPSEDLAALTILGGLCEKLHGKVFGDEEEE
jgi:hypothetical protein